MMTLNYKWSVITLCLLLGILSSTQTSGQTFKDLSYSISTDSFSIVKIKMADYNNDGKMDLFAQGYDSANHHAIILIPKDSLEGGTPFTIYNDTLKIFDWLVADMNNDNHVDVVLFSQSPSSQFPLLRIKYNILDSTNITDFQLNNISEAGSIFSTDFDQNGWRDLAVSSASLDIFYQNNGQFKNTNLKDISEEPLKIFSSDYNNDTYKDFLISLKDSTGLYSEIWKNSGASFGPINHIRLPYAILADEMDVNANGIPDYVIYTNNSQVQLYFGKSDSLKMFKSWSIEGVKDLFLADVNADGRTDIFIGADTSRILFQNEDSVFTEQLLELPNYTSLAFAHLDTDGNLDLIASLDDTPNNTIAVITNTTLITNNGPSASFISAGIFIDGDLRLFWESSSDDFTAANSLTYDVFVEGKVQSDFDWFNYKRLLINKGNAGYAHEYLVKNVSPGQTDYTIQAIDNSYQTNQLVCSGGVIICQTSDYHFEYLCGPNLIEFNFPETRAWYSVSKGFLGFSNEFSQYFAEDDTLYSVLPYSLSCNDQQAWIIKAAPELKITASKDTILCIGSLFEHQLDSSIWASAEWRNNQQLLSDSLNISYQVLKSDTLFLEAKSHLGCSAFDTLIINATSLEINLWQDTVVCLPASLTYKLPSSEWESAIWTNQNSETLSTNLILSLTPTTQQTIYIKATSRLGCEALDTIKITTEEVKASVTEESISIFKGELANLQANGGLYYEWIPDIDLNNSLIANPQSSTLESIVYTVIVTGELGCSDSAQVSITVLPKSFAPNLFTPNGDGNNENWKILELEGVSKFRFIIVDREGQIMYETTQEYEASNIGWDGSKNGTPQPSGVYFWKISGRYIEGNEITLNGAKEGQILLMR